MRGLLPVVATLFCVASSVVVTIVLVRRRNRRPRGEAWQRGEILDLVAIVTSVVVAVTIAVVFQPSSVPQPPPPTPSDVVAICQVGMVRRRRDGFSTAPRCLVDHGSAGRVRDAGQG